MFSSCTMPLLQLLVMLLPGAFMLPEYHPYPQRNSAPSTKGGRGGQLFSLPTELRLFLRAPTAVGAMLNKDEI